MWRVLLSIIAMSLVCGVASAQQFTQTVRGSVFDQDSKEPLPGATIIVLDSHPLIGTTTDATGDFILERVPVGRQTIQVSYIGFDSWFARDLDVHTGKQVVLQVGMVDSFIQSDEVVITPAQTKHKPLNSMAALSSRQFSTEEADRYAGGLGDPARLASSFAGVASPSISSNGISVRGNNPSGLQWRIEGVEVPSPNHFADLTIAGAGLLTALSNTVMGNSDFYTGAFPAEFGNASSGVFDIRLKSGNPDIREHTVQASILGMDVASEGPFRKGGRATYLANYRYSTMGLVAPFLPDDSGLLKYQDVSWKVNLPTQRAGTFSVFGVGALDGIDMVPGDSSEWVSKTDQDYSETTMHLYASGISHKVIINPATFVSTTLSVSGNGVKFEEERLDPASGRLPRSRVSNRTQRYTLQSRLDHRFGPRHTNNSGFYISQLGYDLDVEESPRDGAPLESIVNGSGSATLIQAFTQSQVRPNANLVLNAGLHTMVFRLNGAWTLEPRLSATYALSPRQDISIAYGLHSRIEPLSVYFVSENNRLPNRNLKLMQSAHYGVSYNAMLTDNIRLNVEPYYQHHYDVPVSADSYVSTINTRNNLFFSHALTNNGSGRNVGVDFTFEQFMNKGVYYLLTGSLFNSTYTAADGVERNTRFNKNHVFNALLGKEWRTGKSKNNRINANIRLNYLGGNRIESIDHAASLADEDVVYGESHGVLSFSGQHAATPILSFSVAYRKNKPSYSSMWSLQILNATGAEEYEKDFYNIKTNTMDTKYTTIVLPNISYRIDF